MDSYNGFMPELRNKAVDWLNRQWKSGAIRKPFRCHACGQTRGPIHAHTEDYSEPFGWHTQQYHLCYRCHLMLHCRYRNRPAFDRYRQDVRNGLRFDPAYGFPAIKAHMAGQLPGYLTDRSMIRSATCLDEIDGLTDYETQTSRIPERVQLDELEGLTYAKP